MSFSSYANFRSAVITWLDVDDTVSAEVDDLITIGENKVNAEVRHRLMEKALSTTIASGTIAVPTDYLEMKHLYIDGTPTQSLQRKATEWIYQKYPVRTSSAKPKYFARDAATFVFGPYPDSNYTVKGTYFYRLAALSSSLHDLFTAYPQLYLFAVLSEAEPFIGRDGRLPVWEAKFQAIKAAVMKEDGDEKFSGGPLQVTVANG